MKLNLSDIFKSDIKYKISQYPDGQQNIVIGDSNITWERVEVSIESRFNSWKDLELIICANQALKRLGVEEIHLYIPYLLGARSDREFQTGGNSYLVDVVAPVINLQEFASVTSMDVHSDVAQACIKRFRSISNLELVKFALNNIKEKTTTIVSPDSGAEKKVWSLLKSLDYKGSVVVASKHRELSTGKILSTKINVKNINGTVIIIDDLIDGGKTFIEIAKAINSKMSPSPEKYLIVTHGIFSAGYKELHEYFDGIYCTNSVKDIGEMEFDGWKMRPSYIKQLKVI